MRSDLANLQSAFTQIQDAALSCHKAAVLTAEKLHKASATIEGHEEKLSDAQFIEAVTEGSIDLTLQILTDVSVPSEDRIAAAIDMLGGIQRMGPASYGNEDDPVRAAFERWAVHKCLPLDVSDLKDGWRYSSNLTYKAWIQWTEIVSLDVTFKRACKKPNQEWEDAV